MITVKFKRLHTEAELPYKSTKGAACYDISLPIDYPPLNVGEIRIVPLGWSVEIPEGYEIQVRPRSGLASKGIMVVNSPGCIDSDYRGEIGVILMNISGMIQPLEKNMRICQLKLAYALDIDMQIVDEISDTERGEGGFGSTDIKETENEQIIP
jgi:dUTP pyrophosphatase